MLKNYLLSAWNVLQRRKFYTFVSLFGITLTLTVLMVVITVISNYLYPPGPEKNSANFLTVSYRLLESSSSNSGWFGLPSFRFLADNVSRLKTPENISFYTVKREVASYLNGNKLVSQLKRTDAEFWKILDFDFVEGQAFSQSQFEQGKMVAVINTSTRRKFFGEGPALGKTFVINEQMFTVVGVVENVSSLEDLAYAEIWVPYTTLNSNTYQNSNTWSALLYHSNPSMMKEISDEYINLLKTDFKSPAPSDYDIAIGGADTRIGRFSRRVTGSKTYDSGAEKVLSWAFLLGLSFMLLPAINLINLNVSRIMERASEIGVRKSYGASSNQLVIQFVVENLLITAIGGITGLLLTWAILPQLEASGLFMGGIELNLNWYSFIYGFSLIVIFALLSGVYPAYKMSRMHPVKALRGGS